MSKKAKSKKIDTEDRIKLVAKDESGLEEIDKYTALDCKLTAREGIQPIASMFPTAKRTIHMYVTKTAIRAMLRRDGLATIDFLFKKKVRDHYKRAAAELEKTYDGKARLVYLATYLIVSKDIRAVVIYYIHLPIMRFWVKLFNFPKAAKVRRNGD